MISIQIDEEPMIMNEIKKFEIGLSRKATDAEAIVYVACSGQGYKTY